MNETDDIMARLRDLISTSEFAVDAAVGTIEAQATYITRLEERCAALEGQVEAGAAEIERLRGALAACARHTGGHADGATTDFLMHVPEQVRMHVERLRAEPPGIVTRAIEIHHRAEAAALKEEVGRLRADVRRKDAALRRADQFITNGVEFGFIRMPDADTPDPAHETPGIIRAALQLQEPKP